MRGQEAEVIGGDVLLGSGSWRGGVLVWWCWAFEGEVEGSAGDGADDFGTGGVVRRVHFGFGGSLSGGEMSLRSCSSTTTTAAQSPPLRLG